MADQVANVGWVDMVILIFDVLILCPKLFLLGRATDVAPSGRVRRNGDVCDWYRKARKPCLYALYFHTKIRLSLLRKSLANSWNQTLHALLLAGSNSDDNVGLLLCSYVAVRLLVVRARRQGGKNAVVTMRCVSTKVFRIAYMPLSLMLKLGRFHPLLWLIDQLSDAFGASPKLPSDYFGASLPTHPSIECLVLTQPPKVHHGIH